MSLKRRQENIFGDTIIGNSHIPSSNRPYCFRGKKPLFKHVLQHFAVPNTKTVAINFLYIYFHTNYKVDTLWKRRAGQ